MAFYVLRSQADLEQNSPIPMPLTVVMTSLISANSAGREEILDSVGSACLYHSSHMKVHEVTSLTAVYHDTEIQMRSVPSKAEISPCLGAAPVRLHGKVPGGSSESSHQPSRKSQLECTSRQLSVKMLASVLHSRIHCLNDI